MKEEHRKFILDFLSSLNNMWTSPTTIGRAYGESVGADPFKHHSSWASPKCKKLVQEGILERNKQGHYRLVGGR